MKFVNSWVFDFISLKASPCINGNAMKSPMKSSHCCWVSPCHPGPILGRRRTSPGIGHRRGGIEKGQVEDGTEIWKVVSTKLITSLTMVYGNCNYVWLLVSNMNCIFHNIWDVILPIDSYFSEGFKPPTSSGKHTKIHGQLAFLMGKSTISMAMFNSKL